MLGVKKPGFRGLFDDVYDFMRYFVHFETEYYPALWDHIICLFVEFESLLAELRSRTPQDAPWVVGSVL